MGRVSLYVGVAAGLFLIFLAIYVSPLITDKDDDYSPVDGAIELSLPTAYSPTPAQRKEILNVEKTFDVVRGKNSSFDVTVTNPFENSTIEGLDLTVDGSFAKYLKIEDIDRTDAYGKKILSLKGMYREGLKYGETQTYKITVSAPNYVDRGTYYVDLVIHKGNVSYRDYPAILSGTTGKVIKFRDITFEIVEKRTVALSVHTVDEDEGEAAINDGIENLEFMQSAGFGTKRVERLLEDARSEMSDGDFEAVIEIGEEISKIKETAFSARDEINGLGSIIKDAEEIRGLKVPETKELLSLATAAFEREDYETALQRVNDAKLVYSSETRGKVNYAKVLLDNLTAVIAGAAAFVVVAIVVFNRASAAITVRRLKSLDLQEANIIVLMKEAQENYYVEKTLSFAAYKEAVDGFTRKLTENKSERAKLKARRAAVIGPSKELESLKKERKNLEGLLRDAQDRYYNKKTMSKREYHEAMEHYLAMQVDVEEAIAVLETKVLK